VKAKKKIVSDEILQEIVRRIVAAVQVRKDYPLWLGGRGRDGTG
jgi:hypothetical protein